MAGRHRRPIEGACLAMLPPELGGPDSAALAGHVERFLDHLSPAGRAGVLTLLWGLDAAAVATAGTRLDQLGPAERERLLERVSSSGLGRDGLDACKATLSLVAGADRFAEEMWRRGGEAPPARLDAELDVTPAGGWPSASRCDVVVIG